MQQVQAGQTGGAVAQAADVAHLEALGAAHHHLGHLAAPGDYQPYLAADLLGEPGQVARLFGKQQLAGVQPPAVEVIQPLDLAGLEPLGVAMDLGDGRTLLVSFRIVAILPNRSLARLKLSLFFCLQSPAFLQRKPTIWRKDSHPPTRQKTLPEGRNRSQREALARFRPSELKFFEGGVGETFFQKSFPHIFTSPTSSSASLVLSRQRG